STTGATSPPTRPSPSSSTWRSPISRSDGSARCATGAACSASSPFSSRTVSPTCRLRVRPRASALYTVHRTPSARQIERELVEHELEQRRVALAIVADLRLARDARLRQLGRHLAKVLVAAA